MAYGKKRAICRLVSAYWQLPTANCYSLLPKKIIT